MRAASCQTVVTISDTLEELAREVARAQGQHTGREEDSETSDESGQLRVPKSARVVSGRRNHRLRILVAICDVETGSQKNRSWNEGVRTVAERRNYQTALGSFLKFVQKRTLPLVADGEIDAALVAYSNDCFLQGAQHHHGSQLLAAVMDRWPSFSRFGSRILPRFVDA